MNKNKKNILISLIHNNNELRNIYVKPKIDELLQEINSDEVSTKIESNFQHEIIPHSFFISLLRDLIYIKLRIQWHIYRKNSLLNTFSFVYSVIKELTFNFLHKWRKMGFAWRRASAIESIVTAKHIHAWEIFLESGADYLICFEDDVIFKKDSIERIKNLIKYLKKINIEDNNIYIDLAGGLSFEELGIDLLESSRTESFRSYFKPVTNTACAYLMSRSLVIELHKKITYKPILRLIGIDWMINALFINLVKAGIDCICMHSAPTIFKHGSTTGEYSPWER